MLFRSLAPEFRNKVISVLKTKAGLTDIEEHIKVEKMISPRDWLKDYNVYHGATFNLGHGVFQMLYFRPHNKYEDLENCYIVGGGTHPGSGLPTIYESGRISARMLCKKYNIRY